MQAQEALPQDLAAAHTMIVAERAARLSAEAEVAAARADRRVLDIEIERLKLEIARLRRERFGSSAEGSARIAQLELALEDIEETAAAVEAAEESTTAEIRTVGRRKPARRPLPDHLPRVRVVEPSPSACPCCGGELRKLGEDVTETLERVPARWYVVQHVREKFSCRCCETISQPPAPFHPIARGRAGAHLLAEVVFAKYGLHLPLHRQSARFSREGIELDVSTLADWVGAVSVALRPLVEAIAAHARAGPRVHADDTPLQGFSGVMQADAFSGFGRLYVPGREGGPVIEAACWAHARRKFYEMADLKKAPIAIEAVGRIDALFAIEREINGLPAERRLMVRAERSRPLVTELEDWLRRKRATLSAKSPVAKAIDYMLKRWPAFTRFLEDGRVCLSNNAAERILRGIAVGRRNWTFAGSDTGGERAAALYTLIETAKLNGVDPRAWLADVLERLPGHPARRIDELLPWNWKQG
jgi:transposase